MTPGALILARDGGADATAAATALWASIVGDGNADPVIPERVGAVYAGAAVDLIGVHVGSDTDVPDAVLRESVSRLGMFLSNTEVTLGWVAFEEADTKLDVMSEFHGAALRRSGVMGLLLPWTAKRAGAI